MVTGACGDGEDRPNQVEAGSPATGRSPAGTGGGGDGTGPPPFTAEEADTVVQVQLRDFGFFGIPQKVRGPKVLFVAANAGPGAHEMEVSDAGGRVLAGVEPFPAGESRTLAAELVPGTYTVQCLVKQGALSHVDFGMVTTVAVE